MSTQIDLARIVLLNRTTRELAAANPVLLAGEAAIADVGTVNPSLRFGDGVRPWVALPSFGAGTGIGGGAGTLLSPVTITPGSGVTLRLNGATDEDVLEVFGTVHTAGTHRLANFRAPNAPGLANGVLVQAGTNAEDYALCVASAVGASDKDFFIIRGDGSGFLGPSPENALYWSAQGQFNVRGTARLPGKALSELTDVQLAALTAGNVLAWDGGRWINVPPLTGAVTEIRAGTGLSGGVITSQGTIALADTAVTPGEYTNADITIDAQGRISAAANGGAPALATLPDVSLATPAQGQVLAWDGTLQRWVNTSLPGGTVIALASLQDVTISDPQGGQMLTWDEASERWVNRGLPTPSIPALAGLSDVVLTSPANGQTLTHDGTRWVNANVLGGSTPFEWDGQGHFNIGGDYVPLLTSIPAVLTVTGTAGTNAHAVTIVGSQGTGSQLGGSGVITSGYGLYVLGNQGQGSSYGLYVRAGGLTTDNSMLVQNWNMTRTHFTIRGDGAPFLPSAIASSGATMVWNSTNGHFGPQSSSIRVKRDIRPVPRAHARGILGGLRAITYHSLLEGDDPHATHYGLVAEEVAEVDPRLVYRDKEGKPMSVAYDRIAMLLLPLVQELLGMEEPEGEFND